MGWLRTLSSKGGFSSPFVSSNLFRPFDWFIFQSLGARATPSLIDAESFSRVEKQIKNLKNKHPTPKKPSKLERDREKVYRDFQNDFCSLEYVDYDPNVVYAEQTNPYHPMTIDHEIHPKMSSLEPFNPFYPKVFNTNFYSKLFFQIFKHVQEGSKVFLIDSGFPTDSLHSFEFVYLTEPPKKLHISIRDRLDKLYLLWFFSNPDLPNNIKARVIFTKWFKSHRVLKEATEAFMILESVVLGELNEN